MAPSKLRKALGAVKDQTSIGLAKVGSGSAVVAELDVAVVKATRHSESFPADERHIREVISLTSYSRAHVDACVASLSRRLGRTRSWAVALKTLVLVHRLLADGGAAFEQEVFYATRRGTRMLNMSDFSDRSCSATGDYSAFVRTYAAYLDDRLEYRMQTRQGGAAAGARRTKLLRDELYHSPGNRFTEGFDARGDDEDAADAEANNKAVALVTKETPTSEMTLDELLAKAQQLQHLLDRFLACCPIGAAKSNRVVSVALFPLVKESVQLYCELTEVMAALIERFAEMETDDCERVHGVFCGLAKQIDQIDAFYAWCKDACICRHSDVPEVELITAKKLELMDEFVRDRRAAATSLPRLPPPSPEEPSSPDASPVEEFDMNATKALPALEDPPAAVQEEHSVVEHAEPEPPLVITNAFDDEADFLNLKGDAMSGEEHGNQLALALFDGNPAGSAPEYDVFDHSSGDWETALVQSASALSNQRAQLGGGLNMMVLDGMYSHATASTTAQTFYGSASSVAMRPPGAPMLALPAPPGTSAAPGMDPFAASMVVPPPTYVQMSDMQTKQHFLTEEQMVWQQYGKNGMQGQGALAMLQQRPQQEQIQRTSSHNSGGYH